MSIDAIDRMVQQANPIPDPTLLEAIDVDRGSIRHGDLEVEGTEVVLIDLARTGERSGRARRRVVAAAAAAVVLVAAGALVLDATDDGNQRGGPTSPSPTPTTTPDGPCPPWDGGAPGCGAMHLPPPGATPSTPEHGELVATIAFSAHNTQVGEASFNLFADGRLIRLGNVGPDVADNEAVPGGVVEQALTAEGVELVRAEFLASGLFDPDDPPASGDVLSACWCVIRVRDGGQLRSTGTAWDPSGAAPVVQRRADRFVDYIAGFDSSLPARAWADREIRTYVPSRYVVSVYGPADANGAHHPLTDPAAALAQWVPAEVADLVAGANRGPGALLTPADAQQLVEALDEDGISTSYWAPRLQYQLYLPEGTELFAYVDLTLLLPDGMPPLTLGS